MVVIQNRLAADRSASDPSFRRLIWIPHGLESEDETYAAFVDRLRSDSALQQGAEILRSSLEALETEIDEKLKPPEPEPAAPVAAPQTDDDGLKRVYLLCDESDLEGAQALADLLWDHDERLEVDLPLFEEDEARNHSYHKDNLTTCDGVILYFGESGMPWLKTKLMDLAKAAGWRRSGPIAAKAVYVASPERADKERIRTREAEVLTNYGEPSAEALAPFLAVLLGESDG